MIEVPDNYEELMHRKTKRINGGCIVWTGALDRIGYAHYNGGKNIGVFPLFHRVVYQEEIGEIPEGAYVGHTCPNHHCLNPAHLRITTKSESMLQRSQLTGTLGGKHITDKLAKKIIKRLKDGYSIYNVAHKYGVSMTTVKRYKDAL